MTKSAVQAVSVSAAASRGTTSPPPCLSATALTARANMRGRLGEHAGQHGQGLFAGRQRGQHVDVRGREAACHPRDTTLALQLVVALGEFLDQTTGSAGVLRRERIQQRTDQRVLDALVFGTFDGARSQGVLDDPQVHTGFASLLAHRGHLTDRDARVLGSNQGVRLGGDFRQFGDDFLLLGQIESHCTPPNELRSRLLPLAVLGDTDPGAGDADRIPVVAVPEKFQKGCTIYAGLTLGRFGLSDPASIDGDSLPCRASCPSPHALTAPAVFDGSRRIATRAAPSKRSSGRRQRDRA